MSAIVEVRSREILDSRGYPTLEAGVWLESGANGRAAVPSGASTGQREAVELRDGDKNYYLGKGVLTAVSHCNEELREAVLGLDAQDQRHIDRTLMAADGTANKARLGANAVLGISLANARAAAEESGLPLYRYLGGVGASTLPLPLMNLINGGVHADNRLDLQECMVVPVGFSRFTDALRCGVEIFHHLKSLLRGNGYTTTVGDEGGFAPDLDSNEMALELLVQAIQKAGYQPGREVFLALDVAASELFTEGGYRLTSEGRHLSVTEFIDYLEGLTNRFPIASIEDGMDQNDWEGWQALTERLETTTQLVGDDLFVTNREILAEGIYRGVGNAILVKVNQIGTLSQTLEVIELARRAGYAVIVSHRSGETEDPLIADLAVAANCGQIKAGSAARGERIAKYNRLLKIAEELGEEAQFLGTNALSRRRDSEGSSEA